MFADDICVFCPSVRGLQSILDICQAFAELHGIIFNCRKTVCMMFKTKSAKSMVILLLILGRQSVKSVNHYQYLGIVLGLDTDRHSETNAISILCSKQAAKVSQCSNAGKMYFFVPCIRPCMHHNYGGISGSQCRQGLRVVYNFGCRAPYNLPW